MGAGGCWGRNRSAVLAVACTGLKSDAWLKWLLLSQEPFRLALGRVCLFLLCSRFHSGNQFAFLPAINMGGKTVSTWELKAPCFSLPIPHPYVGINFVFPTVSL